MSEIHISHPTVNPTYYERRRESYVRPRHAQWTLEAARRNNVTPTSHPRLVDCGAGDGQMAYAFVEAGWNPNNTTCIDKFASPDALVPEASWHYIDLQELGYALRNNQKIPTEVQKLKGQFDIVIDMLNDREGDLGLTICNFFVRKGGFIYTDDAGNSGGRPFSGIVK